MRGYACGNGYNEAEEAHWAPFWNSSVQYIHKTYKKPWNNDAKGLIAFLFGVISHGVADTLWHSLNMDQGFIQAMQHLNYRGSYPRAHSDADIGGEFLLARFAPLDYLAGYWKIPTADLVEIYRMTGRNVTQAQLAVCTTVGFALVEVNQVIGRYVAPAWMQRSNFLVEQFFTYFRGGLTSMGLGVAECWTRALTWLDRGFQTTKCAHMGSNDQGPPRKLEHKHHHTRCAKISNFFQQAIYQDKHISVRTTTASMVATGACVLYERTSIRSATFYSRGILKTVVTLFQQMQSIVFDSFAKKQCQTGKHIIKTDQDYSRLGHSIVTGDFDNDGVVDIVIGAPGYSTVNQQDGAVFFVSALKESKNIQNIQDVGIKFTGPTEGGSEFGYSMAVVDLNRDGIPDLAVSAPHVGQTTDLQDGEVYVRFGGRNFTTKGWDLIIQGNVTRFSDWDDRLTLLGQVLQSGDIDGDGFADLIIGSPRATFVVGAHQRGIVQAFLSSSNHRRNVSFYQADWTMSGFNNYALFGTSVLVHNQTMYIGAPGEKAASRINSGKVYEYEIPRGFRIRPRLVHEIAGPPTDGQFGSFIANIRQRGKSFITISSISENADPAYPIFTNFPGLFIPAAREGYQGGRISVYDNTQSSPVAVVQGTASLGHFGSKVMSIGEEDVLISEPIVFGGKDEFIRTREIASKERYRGTVECLLEWQTA
jgi:glycosylphosphatidylinositol phospholipase D